VRLAMGMSDNQSSPWPIERLAALLIYVQPDRTGPAEHPSHPLARYCSPPADV
jgi:hypothetical protein